MICCWSGPFRHITIPEFALAGGFTRMGGGSVRRIRLATLDEGFDISRRNEPDLMTESCDLACPIMALPHASIPTRHAGSFLKKRRTSLRGGFRLNTGEPSASVNLENLLGQIEPDASSRRGLQVKANSDDVFHPGCE